MHEYEIRILSAGHMIAVTEEMHLNDHGAVRSARKLAMGKTFEVWRGLDCIYKAQAPAHRIQRPATEPLGGREIF